MNTKDSLDGRALVDKAEASNLKRRTGVRDADLATTTSTFSEPMSLAVVAALKLMWEFGRRCGVQEANAIQGASMAGLLGAILKKREGEL